jgi:hypothetical protein
MGTIWNTQPGRGHDWIVVIVACAALACSIGLVWLVIAMTIRAAQLG